MESNKSIRKNMMMSIILTSSNFIFPLITYSHVARVLLPAGTGKVAFVQAAISYFAYIAALGVSGYGTREAAVRRNDRKALSQFSQELITINLISTIVAYIALIVSVLSIPKFFEYRMLFAVMSLNFLLQTIGMEWLYRALEQYSYITIRSLIFKCISVALTFLLIRSPDDYVVYGFLTVFTTSASGIFNFVNVRKYIDLRKTEKYELKKHLKPIMVFFMSSIIISVYGHFDGVMLGFMEGDDSVGIYNAALKIKNIILSVSTAVTSVLIPRMSVYYASMDTSKIYNLLVKSLRITGVLMLPLSLFVILNSSDVLLFICGSEYLPARQTLIVLMLCCVVLSITNLLGNQILIPKGDEKRYSVSVFIGMWINLVLNFVMIPIWGSAGAAISTLITETFNMFWMGIGCKAELKYLLGNVRIQKYILASGIALMMTTFVRSVVAEIPLLIRLVLTTCTFGGCYFFSLLLVKEPLVVETLQLIRKKYTASNKK